MRTPLTPTLAVLSCSLLCAPALFAQGGKTPPLPVVKTEIDQQSIVALGGTDDPGDLLGVGLSELLIALDKGLANREVVREGGP